MAQLMTEAEKSAGLEAAVTRAAEALESGLTEQEVKAGDSEEQLGEEEEEEETEEISEESNESDELDDASVDEAKRLYKALKDPKVNTQLLAALAHEAGLTIIGKKPFSEATPAEEKKAVKAIKEVLSESLGKEFEFLVPKLGPVLDEMMDRLKAENQQTVNQIQLRAVNDETAATMVTLDRETKGNATKLQNRMAALANEFPIGPKVSVDRYVRNLYTLAAAERSSSGKTSDTNRIRSNANDTGMRVQGTTSGNAQTVKSVIGKSKLSLNDSVKAAYAELAKGRTR